MSAARITIIKRGAVQSGSPFSAFRTKRRVVRGLLPDPAAAAAPHSPGPFLYRNRRGFADAANFKGDFKLDTLAVKKLEAQEVPTNQAEAITSAITDSMQNTLSKWDLEKMEMSHDEKIFKLRCELECFKEKRPMEIEKLKAEVEKLIEKMMGELKSDVRVDVEKSRSESKVQIEALHRTSLKYFVGLIVSVGTIITAVMQVVPFLNEDKGSTGSKEGSAESK